MLSYALAPTSAPQFVIRPARAEDKGAVLAFCQHTYDWGDYIPLAWDDWLADTQGELWVATLQDTPVGVAKVTMITPTEAWLEGLRVHQDYRRQGLAWQFLIHCLNVAQQLGAQVARLATSSQNVAVHKTLDRAGLRRVAAMRILEATPHLSADALPLAPLTLEDWPQVSARILQGKTLEQMGGVYGSGWSWQQLTADKLRAHLVQGQVFGLKVGTPSPKRRRDSASRHCGEGDRLVAAAIATVVEEEKVLAAGYLDADGAAAERLADALRQRAATLHLEEIEAVLPAASQAYPAFLSAGYKPEMESHAEVWIYETDWKGVAL